MHKPFRSLSTIALLLTAGSALAYVAPEPSPLASKEIRAAGGALLAGVRLFDVYRGDQLAAGKKSLAYALTYQSDKTLDTKEIDKAHKKIEDRLKHVLKAAIREIATLERENSRMRFHNIVTTAKLIATGAYLREESRGGHYRSDFPEQKANWKHRTFITLAEADKVVAELSETAAA